MKFLLVLILFCNVSMAQVASTPELKRFDSRLLNLEYEYSVDRCFWRYEICELKKNDDCWETHEKCVITQSKRYEYLRKLHGV